MKEKTKTILIYIGVSLWIIAVGFILLYQITHIGR